MTGIVDLRRPVGVGREPSHSVGRPAFGSPAATAAARSAATSGGGPPPSPRPGSYSAVGRRAFDGWTRGGSPACLRVVRRPRGVALALGLVARLTAPAAPRASPTASSIPAPGSPIAANRAGTVSIVNASASTVGTSSQVSGVETRASGSGRTE